MASIRKIYAISVERIPVDVTPPVGLNPTGDPVKMAFMPPGSLPGPSDWKVSDWQSAVAGARTFQARCLVGPATANGALTAGTYTIFIQITDSPEAPVKEAGVLVVT